MSLNSFKFLEFFIACYVTVGIATLIFRKNAKRRRAVWKVLLLLFSLGFIAYADVRFLVVMLFYAAVIYFLGLKIEKKSKPWLQIGVVASIALLGVLKYFDFFVGSVADAFSIRYNSLNIILPLGLSFYTLSGISYLMDVKREKYSADHNIIDVLLYITFFGKITAGPIVRFETFNKSLTSFDGLKAEDFCTGIQFFVLGMFKKMVIANHLGVFVDDVFYAPTAYNSATILWVIVSYSLQIYFDFSGYSDMAIGCSRMLGLSFEKNFNFPYLSKSPTEFWKRWHISLSSWFQEYLYYPLGGNRKGKVRTYINLLIVMLVSGLWHGAAWTFVVWGALHGLGLIVHKIWRTRVHIKSKVWNVISVILTDCFAFLCWVFFRADSFKNAADVFRTAFIPHGGIAQPYSWTVFAISVLAISTIVMIRQKRTELGSEMDYPLLDLKTVPGLTCFFMFCGLTIGMAYVGNTAFIYGAF